MDPVPRSMVTVFAYAGITPATSDCLIRDLPSLQGTVYQRISRDALISRSRSRIASEFLTSQADVLVMIDHDISWEPGDLGRLIRKVGETRSIVAGIYSKRTFGKGVAVRLLESGTFQLGQDRLVRAEYVSTGFFGVHRDVLERIAPELPLTREGFRPYFLPKLSTPARQDELPEYLSEDWAFCERASARGCEIFADLRPALVHNGDHGYRAIDGSVHPPEPGPTFVHRPADLRRPALTSLPHDVAEFAGLRQSDLPASFDLAARRLQTLWDQAKPGSRAERSAWQCREDVGQCAVLENAGRLCTGEAEILETELEGVRGARVLELAAGVAGAGVLLAAAGNDVDSVEPNATLRTFANYRAHRHEAALRWTTEPAPESCDLAVAWELVEAGGCPTALALLAFRALRPGGRLFTAGTRELRPPHPLRLDAPRWHQALGTSGLRRVSERWYERP